MGSPSQMIASQMASTARYLGGLLGELCAETVDSELFCDAFARIT